MSAGVVQQDTETACTQLVCQGAPSAESGFTCVHLRLRSTPGRVAQNSRAIQGTRIIEIGVRDGAKNNPPQILSVHCKEVTVTCIDIERRDRRDNCPEEKQRWQ